MAPALQTATIGLVLPYELVERRYRPRLEGRHRVEGNRQPLQRPRTAIRNPQDFVGGLVLVGLAMLALYGARDLEGAHGVAFGPGTAPRLFAGLLAFSGLAITVNGLIWKGPALERYAVRGPLLITASVLVFAVTIRPLGLVISSFITIIVASMASAETRWLETLGWAAVLTGFCTLLFAYLLGLPLPVWPRF